MSLISKITSILPDWGNNPEKQRERLLQRYISRMRRFDLSGKNVVLRESDGPLQVEKLDVWMEIIIIAADGQKRVREILEFIVAEFGGDAPQELEGGMINLIEQLNTLHILETHTKPRELPYYLKLPVSQQNRHRARALMIEDGFIAE